MKDLINLWVFVIGKKHIPDRKLPDNVRVSNLKIISIVHAEVFGKELLSER